MSDFSSGERDRVVVLDDPTVGGVSEPTLASARSVATTAAGQIDSVPAPLPKVVRAPKKPQRKRARAKTARDPAVPVPPPVSVRTAKPASLATAEAAAGDVAPADPFVATPLPEVEPRRNSLLGVGVARVCAVVILVLCGLNIFWLRWENLTYYWYRPLLNAYSIGVAGFILSRFLVALFYRPPRNAGLEPTVSLIITAFNEEDAIYRTVECCYAIDYPRAKLEVIAVDDGSTDGTIPELERAKKRWPGLVIESFAKNKGKREAMAAGARVSTGEILIYVDSDSFLREDAVRKIVQGFADPTVAAVAGHTEVANIENGLTRMQQARYFVAFRVLKAAESVFGAVTCCPGCFSAYRRTAVLDVLEPWLNQRFLGVQATFGDDRSLTNFLLRRFQVIYASNAVATTIVPDSHRKFLRQQVRWKKSWLRECLIASGFMWKKHPLAAVAFYAQTIFPILAPLIMFRVFVWQPIFVGDVLSMFVYAFGVTLIGLVFSAYYLFWKADGAWLAGVIFTVYYMFVLIWQMPYAILTSRDNRWGTR
jgi:hyaluronan synthase